MRKQYTGLPLSKPDIVTRAAVVWMPLLKVRVSANHQHTPLLHAVVDSGSPHCLFRADVADYLHINLKGTPESEIGGVIGGPKDAVHFHHVNIVIENNLTIRVLAGFMKKLSVAAILGRNGFFDNFLVCFDHSQSPPELEVTRFELVN
jgi:hypothetical protein